METGCHFSPLDDEIIRILNEKNRQGVGSRHVKEFDLYREEPCVLKASGADGVFYGFTRLRISSGGKFNRLTANGSWRETGKPTFISNKYGNIIGKKRSFRFHGRGTLKSDQPKEKWIMYEYESDERKDNFVLCKIVFNEARSRKSSGSRRRGRRSSSGLPESQSPAEENQGDGRIPSGGAEQISSLASPHATVEQNVHLTETSQLPRNPCIVQQDHNQNDGNKFPLAELLCEDGSDHSEFLNSFSANTNYYASGMGESSSQNKDGSIDLPSDAQVPFYYQWNNGNGICNESNTDLTSFESESPYGISCNGNPLDMNSFTSVQSQNQFGGSEYPGGVFHNNNASRFDQIFSEFQHLIGANDSSTDGVSKNPQPIDWRHQNGLDSHDYSSGNSDELPKQDEANCSNVALSDASDTAKIHGCNCTPNVDAGVSFRVVEASTEITSEGSASPVDSFLADIQVGEQAKFYQYTAATSSSATYYDSDCDCLSDGEDEFFDSEESNTATRVEQNREELPAKECLKEKTFVKAAGASDVESGLSSFIKGEETENEMEAADQRKNSASYPLTKSRCSSQIPAKPLLCFVIALGSLTLFLLSS